MIVKITLPLLLQIFAMGNAKAQTENPVHWSYGLKNVSGHVYELHLKAKIDSGWHIYAQQQPAKAIAVPTKIRFVKAASITLLGITEEQGKKERYDLKVAGIVNMEYADEIDFIQRIRLTGPVRVIRGNISFQACTHQKCLGPETIDFSIPVR